MVSCHPASSIILPHPGLHRLRGDPVLGYMIMEWSADKVWIDHGNLCVRGTFYNKRSDVTITKLNEIEMTIHFAQADGSVITFTGKPAKLPMLKIPALSSKSVTLNLGPYEGQWSSWTTEEDYVFTYVNGARW